MIHLYRIFIDFITKEVLDKDPESSLDLQKITMIQQLGL